MARYFPGQTFSANHGHSVIETTYQAFIALPAEIKTRVQQVSTREYTDGVLLMVEVPTWRLAEIHALMPPTLPTPARKCRMNAHILSQISDELCRTRQALRDYTRRHEARGTVGDYGKVILWETKIAELETRYKQGQEA